MHGDSVNLETTGPENEKNISAQDIIRLKILFRPSTKLKDKISGTSLVRQKSARKVARLTALSLSLLHTIWTGFCKGDFYVLRIYAREK